jgi:hypothetical protein
MTDEQLWQRLKDIEEEQKAVHKELDRRFMAKHPELWPALKEMPKPWQEPSVTRKLFPAMPVFGKSNIDPSMVYMPPQEKYVAPEEEYVDQCQSCGRGVTLEQFSSMPFDEGEPVWVYCEECEEKMCEEGDSENTVSDDELELLPTKRDAWHAGWCAGREDREREVEEARRDMHAAYDRINAMCRRCLEVDKSPDCNKCPFYTY